MAYNPQEIEPKWQKYWEDNGFHRAEDNSKKEKKYILVEFPYPSGAGLHVGHVRSYAAMDAVARKSRMEGFNVLYPIGWDAFGLPTENYAIKNKIHPSIATCKNVENYTKQLKSLGLSFDWSREINTTDPEYYKWTQWIFLKLFEKDLAYQAEIPINWCPSCKIGLANEEVVGGGECERCHAPVEKKQLNQWMIKITAYADRLIDDLSLVNFPDKVKAQQINWIGKSEGTEINFQLPASSTQIKVFTTRADTLFGVTAVVLAPENPAVEELITPEHKKEVEGYISQAKKKSDIEREVEGKEKTGVFTGSYCINPASGEKIPVWIGDYVIDSYGGGAVMMVPAHDFRDYDFAKKYGIEIRQVISGGEISNEARTDYGKLINSGEFDGLESKEAIDKITEFLEKRKMGCKKVHYKLRDWVFSRQHYWGEPIPIIHCEKCGQVPVPEKDLPVELPYVEKYQPTGTGESPLAGISDWVNVKCPKCGGPAKRETDTMPNWAGSNWYYLAYVMHGINNFQFPVSKYGKVFKYWMPVDWYNGGFEHTTLHLLYSRFIYKFLFDIGAVPTCEPYQKRTSHGIVLAEDGRKMSKSFGNVINPDELIKEFGADSLRLYEMFMGPFDQAIAWSTNGLKGCKRFLDKVWNLQEKVNNKEKSMNTELERLVQQTIKKVGEDLGSARFNTAIPSLMILSNEFEKQEKISKIHYSLFLIILSPFAPHLAEELWQRSGKKESIFKEEWPKYDERLIREQKITLIIQVGGRVRSSIKVDVGISEEEVKKLAISDEKIKNWIQDKEIKKIIYVPNKIINFIT